MDFGNVNWVGILQTVAVAILIIVVTWILATIAKWLIQKLVSRVSLLQREGQDGQQLGSAIGQIVSLLIWLFGLIALLQLFNLTQVLSPIKTMLESVFSYVPQLFGAAFLFFVGYLIAKIARQLTETALGQFNFGSIASKVGDSVEAITGEEDEDHEEVSVPSQLPSLAGNIVFALILIAVSIAALQVLGIESISAPATQMLQMIFTAIPNILAAAVILAIGYAIGRFVTPLLKSILSQLGTDKALAEIGLEPKSSTPSNMIAAAANVAIMLFFAIMAARVLDFKEISVILDEVLGLGGRVLFGGVIIAAGFILANLLTKLVGSGIASNIVKYATMALFVAMGLKYMGIADSIINLAFGAIVVGLAVTASLAFGLGGRDSAARMLTKLEKSMEKTDN